MPGYVEAPCRPSGVRPPATPFIAKRLWVARFLFLLAVPALRIESLILERCRALSIEQVQLLRMALVVALLSHLSSCGWAAIGWRTMRRAEGSWVLHDDVLRQA